MTRRILVLDNYDSFTYNLVHMLRDLVGSTGDVVVFRNDRIALADALSYQEIVLSPGPGLPGEAGIMPELLREAGPNTKILGVCLGHQCIGEVFGASLRNLDRVCHGKAIDTLVRDTTDQLFKDIPSSFQSGRYHSWVIDERTLPPSLRVTAIDSDNRVMAIRHTMKSIWGVQFHPESVLTEFGQKILNNWLEGA